MSKYNTSTSIIFIFNAGKCHYNAGKSRDNASTGIIEANLIRGYEKILNRPDHFILWSFLFLIQNQIDLIY
ncbi:hypothetical protein WQ57_01410 [Mesobacillus campisalis]|uniref:Uncharacterized protein n=1 Tax=Mesobacillus campisalis TaxID=1408103 RepID=A0A0M2T0L2_9BACI|nr:hypothetical protein WQ57_01410 [Mesobacillus campisalis]